MKRLVRSNESYNTIVQLAMLGATFELLGNLHGDWTYEDCLRSVFEISTARFLEIIDSSKQSILRNLRFIRKTMLIESKTEKSYIIQSWPDIGDDVSLQYGRSLYSLKFEITVGIAKSREKPP